MRKFLANLKDIKIFRKILKKLIFSNTASPLRQSKTQFFHPYGAWGEPFLGLASLWSTDTRWLGSWQPLRHVARLGAPSTLAEERLPRRASACLCLKCIPGLMNAYLKSIIKALHVGNVVCTLVTVDELVMLKEHRFLSPQIGDFFSGGFMF